MLPRLRHTHTHKKKKALGTEIPGAAFVLLCHLRLDLSAAPGPIRGSGDVRGDDQATSFECLQLRLVFTKVERMKDEKIEQQVSTTNRPG